jgi:hypothetical protein
MSLLKNKRFLDFARNDKFIHAFIQEICHAELRLVPISQGESG